MVERMEGKQQLGREAACAVAVSELVPYNNRLFYGDLSRLKR